VICLNIGEAVKCRIIELCKEHNITVNKLSTISGITQSTLNNIVSGRNNTTTISTVKKICDGLGIAVLDFFKSDLFTNLEQEIN
jgi:transcriptional regulator with XRE-family HTH domain